MIQISYKEVNLSIILYCSLLLNKYLLLPRYLIVPLTHYMHQRNLSVVKVLINLKQAFLDILQKSLLVRLILSSLLLQYRYSVSHVKKIHIIFIS